MPRLIDADALERDLRELCDTTDCDIAIKPDVMGILRDAPTADAELVRRGKWTDVCDRLRSTMFRCSKCHQIAYDMQGQKHAEKRCKYEYCPHCGAKMDDGGAM